MGAVVVYQDRVIARGETGGRLAKMRFAMRNWRPSTAHAAPWGLAAVAMYALCDLGTLPHVRWGDHQCAHPRLVFGARDRKAGSCGSVVNLFALPYNHAPGVTSGVLEEECAGC